MNDFVIYIYGEKRLGAPPEPMINFVSGLEKLLEAINKLSANNTRYAVYKVGECIGDFS